jgi:hypothetical protein
MRWSFVPIAEPVVLRLSLAFVSGYRFPAAPAIHLSPVKPGIVMAFQDGDYYALPGGGVLTHQRGLEPVAVTGNLDAAPFKIAIL